MSGGSIQEWYRFLDAHSDDDAVCEVRRLAGRLDAAHVELDTCFRALAYAPDDELGEALRICRTTLSDAVQQLLEVGARFQAGERHRVS